MRMRRRDFHRAALCLALAGWLEPAAARVAAPPRWPVDPFSLGVASGQPRPHSIVLWTRLALTSPGMDLQTLVGADSGVAVRYEIFADAALRQPVRAGEQIAWPSRAFSVHVLAEGLQSGRDYWYRFRCGEATSPIGHTRTAPAEGTDVARLRLGLASCQHYEQGYFAALRDMATSDLDAVLFVGDYIYEGGSPAYTLRKHSGGVPHTLADYRERHAQYKRDPHLQAAHAAHPWIVTLDDHEVVNDYADDRDPAWSDPARFLARRAAAYRAYFEHMPLALAPKGPAMRIHDRFAWGRLADLWTLDCRQFRSHHACADPQRDVGRDLVDCAELADPARSMLGAAQEAWLMQGLANATGRWKLLGQSTQMASAGVETKEGRRVWTDGWDGYPAARERLLAGAAAAGARNLVVLGGDVHRFVAADLRARPNDAASPVIASEIVGGSVTSHGASERAMARMLQSNSDIKLARADERGWALLDVTPRALRCELRATSHPVLQDAQFRTLAAFVVEGGRAGVQAA
ncbi:MAG: alkaline phosphatase D family protein [Variovorax sp.]